MSENHQQTPEEKAAADQAAAEKAAADAAEKAAAKAVKKAEPPKRYAAYDRDHGRYVGGVRDTKREADDIAKGIRDAGRTAEVREV